MSKQITPADQLIAWLLDESETSLTLFGQENGFNERADVIVAADGTDLNEFWQEVQDTVALRNSYRTSLINALTYPVTNYVEDVTVPNDVDFEEASEYGQPVGMRSNAVRIFRGFDFKFYDLAVRYTWMFIAEATQAQLRQNNNIALEADTKLVFRKVMQRLFNPLNSTGFTEKNEPIQVYTFYNGDGEVPPPYKQNTFTSGHNHYLVSGGASLVSANLDTIEAALYEHGYYMANGYTSVLWVNRQEAQIIRTFRVLTGALFDFIPNAKNNNGGYWLANKQGEYLGAPTGEVPGEIGTYGPFHIVEEGYIPAGYVVAVVTGGNDNISNPIGLRQHSNPAYQGLKVIPGSRSDYPLLDSFYRRGVGTGIRHRGAGVVMQIKASGSYAVPAAWDPANG